MKYVYKLTHKNFVENDKDGESVFDTKLLGFFSSEKMCSKSISFYKQLPGFKNEPNSFTVEKAEADVNDFNTASGEFDKCVYYLTNEWYDGKYDHVTVLGCYSTYKKAMDAKKLYEKDSELSAHAEGFCIDEYIIDHKEWPEGFSKWE